MLNALQKRHCKNKAMRHTAFALFFCLSAHAQTNWVDGAAYGTNHAALATAESIASIADGTGSLTIGYGGTTNLTIGHDIDGSIILTNRFDSFTIVAEGASIEGSQYAVLTVIGGTNLTVSGGSFEGSAREESSVLPPVPGQPPQTNTVSSAAMGGVISQTQTAVISNASFSGTTYAPNETTSLGTDGLLVIESSVSIENSTFSGGGTGAEVDAGGHGLYAVNSTVQVSSGTFSGGNNAAALYAVNSDLTIGGGTFEGGAHDENGFYFGLVSIAGTGETNTIALNGGSFNAIGFSGNGTQFVTAGTNLVVDDYVVVENGTVEIDNLSDTPFQTTYVREGELLFHNGFTLSSDGFFSLSSSSGRAGFADLGIESNATLIAGKGTVDVSGNLWLSGGGAIAFTISTNANGSLSANTATFHTDSAIMVDATLAGFGTGTNEVVLVATDSGIFVVDAGGATNAATGANLAENVRIETDTSNRTVLDEIVVDDNLLFRFKTEILRSHWNATGQFATLADELDLANNREMIASIDLIDNPEISGQIVEQTYFGAFNTFQTSLQGLRAAIGQSGSRGTEFREQLKLAPAGAKGPERNNNLRGWGKYYGQYATHDRQGLNPAYDTVLHGGVLGIDASIGNLLIGASGGSGGYRTTRDNDAREDIVSAYGNLYGTYGTDRAYIDAGVAYGENRVETRTADPFRLEGEFDAMIASVYLGAGYDLIDAEGATVFTPEATLQYSRYEQDAYTEKGTAAVPRIIDGFDADSVLGTLGMNISMLNTTALETFGFKLDGRIHWMHEFNPDPSDITFMLEGGSSQYRIPVPALDEDIVRLGIGCSLFNTERKKPRNVMLRLDFDELFGENFNSHNLSAKLIYAF